MGFFLDAVFHGRGAMPGGDEAMRVTIETFAAGIAPDVEHEVRMARTRWLERNGARTSFPCGIAVADPEGSEPPEPDAWGERPVATVPVTVAVTDDAFVFLREGVPDLEPDRVVEVGRFPRAAFVSAHLENARGNRVAAPAGDVFEPPAPCRLVVTWTRDDGTEDRDTFAFMSLSVAEEAAGRFRRSAASA